ncbi:hypothetical protein [Wohlfahrtiimonas chitiniclastica]|uniref:hypothetical protein n=1 Tax=Wohlfahrtiimonas chitiniclastica TaxID=400946 RepID=UPI001BD0563F|nr:hypothetical protein [Wohlfahrtiimonas chitiniclastica]MBS7837722.1 hypothetical protein [Wohlfahrtiimonas chitiniclastica]
MKKWLLTLAVVMTAILASGCASNGVAPKNDVNVIGGSGSGPQMYGSIRMGGAYQL